jgi:nicotinamidase-related amidase
VERGVNQGPMPLTRRFLPFGAFTTAHVDISILMHFEIAGRSRHTDTAPFDELHSRNFIFRLNWRHYIHALRFHAEHLNSISMKPAAGQHSLVNRLAPADISIEKVAYSAFYMTRLEWVLRKCDIRKLIVCGIVTNGGVASSVRDAHVRDFDVTVLSDGCAAFSPEVHETAIAALKPVCRVATIAEIMADMAA